MPVEDEARIVRRRIEPFYEPEDGLVRLYSGDVTVEVGNESVVCAADVTFHLGENPAVSARLEDDEHRFFGADARLTGLRDPLDLWPPVGDWAVYDDAGRTYNVGVDRLVVGSLDLVDRVLVHVSGSLSGWFPAVDVEGGHQARVDFVIAGWNVAVVPARQSADEHGRFSHVVELRRSDGSGIKNETLGPIGRTLFHLLSFSAGQEVGTTILVGLDGSDRAVWATWASPRQRHARARGVRWCTPMLVAEALPVLAAGLDALESVDVMADVVRRAIGFFLVGNADEVLDVRVPVTCTGLELLAWAVLQRDGLMTHDVLADLPTSAAVRIMAKHLGIPTEIPSGFKELEARAASIGHRDAGGPEILFNIRNRLVHPPRRIDRTDWPSSAQMIEAWQLGTWYLELALLRLLGYEGSYWSRLRLGRGDWDVEPVPWAES